MVYKDLDGEDVVSPNLIKYTANFYKADVKASVSVKGDLNQLNLDQTSVGTVKFTNLSDTVDTVSVQNESAKFDAERYISAEVVDGKIVFRLNEEAQEDNLKDGTYKFNVAIKSDFNDVITVASVSIKIARKAPTVKLSATTLNVYDMTGINQEIGRITINKSYGDIAAMTYSVSSAYELRREGNEIVVILKDASKLKVGSSTKMTVYLDWAGDYGTRSAGTKSIKTTTLTFTVKDFSATVKAK